jgi:hypothetical protein
MTASLAKDKTVDAAVTLDAQVALIALQALQQAHSTAKLYTCDTSADEIAKIKSGQVQWAVDQQPYLQGYEAIDSLWLYLTKRQHPRRRPDCADRPVVHRQQQRRPGGQVRGGGQPLINPKLRLVSLVPGG